MKIIIKTVKSKFRQCLYPYKEYHSRGPFIKNDGRLGLSLIIGINRVITLNYSKYLWEVFHKRKVKEGYQVDHVDGDKTNDIIDNLQEITQSENASKGTNKIIKKNIINKNKLFLWCPV